MILLALDFTSASSYLALGPAVAIAEEIGVELRLQPFRVPQVPTPTKVQKESVAERHQRIRAEYRSADLERYAEVQGIRLEIAPYGIDPTFAHGALLVANEHGVGIEFARRVFRGLWEGTLDIESSNEIRKVLQGLDVEFNHSMDLLQAQLDEIRSTLEEQEIYSVPTFLVKGERFIGRQHFPMIRSMLSDERSSPPT